METLFVVTQLKNQNYGNAKAYKPVQFGSSPSGHFREINCRSFQSGGGILQPPYGPSCTTPVKKSSPNSVSSPPTSQKTPSHSSKVQGFRTSPIPISIPAKATDFDNELGLSSENTLFSELWAGPAYSNSPPPSSLPIPKFSVNVKRTVSLDLPKYISDVKVQPIAKSAPASPTREYNATARDFPNVDSATMMLRRILNLDNGNE